MVDNQHIDVFASEGSYAKHKVTGRKICLERAGKGWDLTLQLEAPSKANDVMAKTLAELRDQTPKNAAVAATASDSQKLGAEIDRADPLFRLAVR